MDWCRERPVDKAKEGDSQQSRQKAIWVLIRAWAEGLNKTALIYGTWQKRINPFYLEARDSPAPKISLILSLSGAINRTREQSRSRPGRGEHQFNFLHTEWC